MPQGIPVSPAWNGSRQERCAGSGQGGPSPRINGLRALATARTAYRDYQFNRFDLDHRTCARFGRAMLATWRRMTRAATRRSHLASKTASRLILDVATWPSRSLRSGLAGLAFADQHFANLALAPRQLYSE